MIGSRGRRRVAAVLGACSLLTASVCNAQYDVTREKGADYEVEFEDGDLLGQSLTSYGHLIRHTHLPRRVLLIRPRVSFVPELHKSVENM